MATLSNQLAEAAGPGVKPSVAESRIPVEGYGSISVAVTKSQLGNPEVSVRSQGEHSYEMTAESAKKLASAITDLATSDPRGRKSVTVKSDDGPYRIELRGLTGIGGVPTVGIQPKFGRGASSVGQWDLDRDAITRFTKALENSADKASKKAAKSEARTATEQRRRPGDQR